MSLGPNQIGAILHGDARSVPARRYRDVVCALVADAGGPDHLTEMQIILIRRVAGLTVIAESAEADLCNGKEIDIKEIALIASTLTRLGTRRSRRALRMRCLGARSTIIILITVIVMI